MNKLGVNSKLITSLKYQVLLMDHAYMMTGEDHELVVEEDTQEKISLGSFSLDFSDDFDIGTIKKNKEEIKNITTQNLVYFDSDGLVVFNVDSPVYCYFDYNMKPILYTRSKEFTDRYNNASSVSILYIPTNSFGKLIKVK